MNLRSQVVEAAFQKRLVEVIALMSVRTSISSGMFSTELKEKVKYLLADVCDKLMDMLPHR